jgi:hypothetical protein
MGIYLEKEEYGIPAGLVCSVPVQCARFDYKIVEGLKIDEFAE